jgi:Dolichyl-phosphate-mannose-protein mannosyltransferase
VTTAPTPARSEELSEGRLEGAGERSALAGVLVGVGIVLLAWVARLVLALEIPTPWLMLDELVYAELSKGIADHGSFELRGEPALVYSVLYPFLLAPAWIADAVPTSYGLLKTINVTLMTAAALPVYLLARRVVSAGLALVAVLLTLVIPAFVVSGALITENAFFPAFLLASYAITLAVERPTVTRQGFALVAIGLAAGVRFQGLVLLAVFATAILLRLVLDRRASGARLTWRGIVVELGRYLPAGIVVLIAASGYVLYKVAQGRSFSSGLGAYAGVTAVDYSLRDIAYWIGLHFIELGYAVGLVPMSALIILLGLAVRSRSGFTRAERSFLAVALSAVVWLVLTVGTYASHFAERIEERNMFHVAPILFCCFVLWLGRGLPRPRVLTPIAALLPALLLLFLPLERLFRPEARTDSYSLFSLLRLSEFLDSVGTTKLLLVAGGLATAALVVFLPRRVARPLLTAGLGAFLLVGSYSVYGEIEDYSQSLANVSGSRSEDWIDDRIGRSPRASFLFAGAEDPGREAAVLWQTEFWNRSIGRVYHLRPFPSSFPERDATIDPLTGRVTSAEGGPGGPAPYAVVHDSLALAGDLVVRRFPLALYRVDPPLRATVLPTGVFTDTWTAKEASLSVFETPGNRRARLEVFLSRGHRSYPGAPSTSVAIRLGRIDGARPTAVREAVVDAGGTRRLVFTTPPPPFRLDLTVAETFVPTDLGVNDTRELGVRFDYRISPARR